MKLKLRKVAFPTSVIQISTARSALLSKQGRRLSLKSCTQGFSPLSHRDQCFGAEVLLYISAFLKLHGLTASINLVGSRTSRNILNQIYCDLMCLRTCQHDTGFYVLHAGPPIWDIPIWGTVCYQIAWIKFYSNVSPGNNSAYFSAQCL